MLTDLLRLVTLISRVNLDSHGEIRDRTRKVSLCLIHSTLVVIGLGQVRVLSDSILKMSECDVIILSRTFFFTVEILLSLFELFFSLKVKG